MKPHPGFKALSKKIAAAEKLPGREAGAILAAAARKASARAKSKNPRLRKVK